MKKERINNVKLYYYIIDNYVKSKTPVKQKEIAKEFNMTIGALKNFMYRHNLNKKTYYAKRKEKIKILYKNGVRKSDLARVYETSIQNIDTIIKGV